jgi:uncharacterized membrane protein YccC
MKKSVWAAVAMAVVLWCVSAFAQEQKATGSQVQPQSGQGAAAPTLTPEERAKLREKRQNMTDEERAQLRTKIRERATRPAPEAALQQKVLTDEINTFKQQYQVTRGELESIKQLAIKEKAAETTKAIDKLMARNEEQYQRRLKLLEQRLERFQAAQKGQEPPKPDSNQPVKPAAEPAKPPAKGNADKPK